MIMINPKLGMQVKLHTELDGEVKSKTRTGTIVYVNRKHGWFRVRFKLAGGCFHECYHYMQPVV